jgi:hypothetical protein
MKFFMVLILAASFALASCSATAFLNPVTPAPTHEPCKVPKEGEAPSCGSSKSSNKSTIGTTNDLTAGPKPTWSMKSDSQNGVTVNVTPLNLGASEETLNFQVSFDAQGDLTDQDLTTLSTLTNDFHWTVQPVSWSGALDGSRFSGVLSFPAEYDGEDFLYQMASITVTIQNMKAPQRVFSWQITP